MTNETNQNPAGVPFTGAAPTALADPRAAALELMERVLRDGRPMAAEYPLVFGPNATGEIEVAEADGRPASACAWLRRDLVTPDATIPAAFVGSVATEDSARGQGLGTEVVDRAIARASDEGAAIALLWADDPLWYQSRGWIPFGTERVHAVEDAWAFLLPDPTDVRSGSAADAAGIHALYEQHPSRVARTEDETRALLGVPAMRITVCERDGEIVGYACMGRGEDLMNVVHEWGGQPDASLACLSQLWRDAEAERAFLMLGETDVDLAAYFSFVKAPGATGSLAMARIANIDALAQVFRDALPAEVNITVPEDTDEPTLDLRAPSGAIRLTGHEILLAMCPPNGDRRVTDVVEQELGLALHALPLKPFVRGLDGI
ncbi:MAG: GNAT family N-acetyltransferase [Planctomycetota bacterium]